jgi:hypothetical protein
VDEKVKAIQSDVPIFLANMSEEIVGDSGTFSLVSFYTYPSDMLYHHSPVVCSSCFYFVRSEPSLVSFCILFNFPSHQVSVSMWY